MTWCIVVQKKKTEAAAHGTLTVGPRSNFAEFRRQMKLKQKSSSSSAAAAADDNDEVRSSPRRSASQSPAPTTPRQQLPSSGIVSPATNNSDSSRPHAYACNVSSIRGLDCI